MKKLIEVEIFGQTFTVTSEDNEGYVKELASYVDRRMRLIAEAAKTNIPARVAIMAALSIADDYYKTRQREDDMQREAEYLATSLLARIEQSEKVDSVTTGEDTTGMLPDANGATPSEGTKAEIRSPS
jgi:cell division protein ZapA